MKPTFQPDSLARPAGGRTGRDRLLIVSPWYKPTLGGVAVVAQRLLTGLHAEGFDTDLLVSHGGGSAVRPVPAERNVWHVDVPGGTFTRATVGESIYLLARGLPCLAEIRRFLRARSIGTLLLLYPIDTCWPFVMLRHTMDLRLIVSCHGNDLARFPHYNAPLQWLLRQALGKADAVIVCADHLLPLARDIAGPSAPPLHVIDNCVDTDHFTPPPSDLGSARGPATILHASNFAPKKRTADIVEAFARADLPAGSRLRMVGTGSEHGASRRLAQRLGLETRVDFTGPVLDVRPHMWQSDCFVLASDNEGSPLVLLEAMACGLPWISTPWGVAAKIPSGQCGLTVPIGNIRELAAAMTAMARDERTRRDMGRRARQVAEARYGLRLYLKAHVELFRSVQAGDRRETRAA